MKTAITLCTFTLAVLLLPTVRTSAQVATPMTPEQISSELAAATAEAWAASPYAALAENYFTRFSRDETASIDINEISLDENWVIVIEQPDQPLLVRMAEHLREFLLSRMNLDIKIVDAADAKVIRLLIQSSDNGGVSEAFTIAVQEAEVTVAGNDAAGLRDGVVRLVDMFGFRAAPYLEIGTKNFTPRLKVRLGATPKGGSTKDLVFMGYNAVFAGGGNLHSLSQSNAIPELYTRHVPALLEQTASAVKAAEEYALKTYAFLETRKKFAANDPVFDAHPEIRGALTWKADGEYVLCTEAPLVKQYLREGVQQLFRTAPGLDGAVFIVGGEGFYHCFMRPYNVEKGHTNCARCEALGPDTVVSNLCNELAAAAREVNPQAEIIAWPYSAMHVWSSDAAQSGFIAKLKPGTGIFTEIEKDEYVPKADGVNKHIWDYSIDLIGPGERAKQQIAACRAAGIPIYLKSEPELGFEAPRLPHIPCMDRWADRANALADSGADGAWVFPAFRPNYGTSAAELNKFFWHFPVPDKDVLLNKLADRIAGKEAGDALRTAWKHVSNAVEFSPELPNYYTGPYYLGPAHPMSADINAQMPEVFYGYYLFYAEITDAEGMKKRPTYITSPTGNPPVFVRFYRDMEKELKLAVDAIEAAAPTVPERCKLTFNAEASPIRWFYHTARTHANFYDSCMLRDKITAITANPSPTSEETAEGLNLLEQWKKILEDERQNTEAAMPVMEADVRLDFRFGGDHTFSHGIDMLRAKLEILNHELSTYLPTLAEQLGQTAP